MDTDYLLLSERERPAVAGLLVLLAVAWAQSQGILAPELQTGDWPHNICCFLRVILKCSCVRYCLLWVWSLLVFSSASALPCFAHYSVSIALMLWKKAQVLQLTASQGLLLLNADGSGCICTSIKCLLYARVSKKPVVHNPESQQINEAAATKWVRGRVSLCCST